MRDVALARKPGVPGGPAPPVPSRDPATLIEAVRDQGERSALPFANRIGSRLGHALHALEVYRGTAARRACDLLGARALAVHNVLLFREDAPSLATVLHEVAHVVQQRAFSSPAPRLAARSLAVADPASAAEREARAFARGELDWSALARAPPAIYRDEKQPPGAEESDENDQPSPELRPWEARFKRFLEDANNPFKLISLGVDGAKFARVEKPSGDLSPEEKFKRSSERKFQHRDFHDIVTEAVDGDLPKIAKLGKKWQLAIVGPAEMAQRYALIDDGDYQDRIFEIGANEKTTLAERQKKNAASLKFYRKAVASIARLSGSKWEPVAADPEAVTDAELKQARHTMVAEIVGAYSTDEVGVSLLYKEVIASDPPVFAPPYSRIQGTIFEQWVKKYRPDAAKKAGQPVFQDPKLGTTIFGDFVIIDGGKHIIGEVKGLSSAPGEDDREQMRGYFRVLTDPDVKKRHGYYVKVAGEAGPDDADPGAKTQKVEAPFDKVVYHFPNADVASKWMPDLLKVFATRLDLFDTVAAYPKLPPADKVTESTKTNPVITVTIEDAKRENTRHRVENPKVPNPGIKLKYFEVMLAVPGYAPITSGELAIEVDTKGGLLASEAPSVKKITPVEPEAVSGPTAKGAKSKKDVVTGTVANGLDKVQPSGLDKFLKRVHTEVDLTDDGIAGKIWVEPGDSFIKKIRLDEASIAASYTKANGFAAKGLVAVSYEPAPKKFSGSITVEYRKEKWSFVGKGTVGALIEGLDPFDVVIKHEDDVTTIGAEKLTLRKKLAGIDLQGKVQSLTYDVGTGGFNADGIHFDVELGAFGKAGADAAIRNNELEKLSFSYESKELRYPKGKSPILSGKLRGSVDYEKGRYGGSIGGTAYLQIPALQKISKSLGDLGFVVDVRLADDGRYGGSIALAEDKPILLGEYLRIPQLKLALDEEGAISSRFAIEVTEKLKYVKEARVACQITKDGRFEVLEASGKVKIGDEKKDRVAAQLGLAYSREQAAFIVSGTVWVRIKEGMVAVGELTWNSATGKIDGTLSIERISLLSWKGHKEFLKLKKQIILVSIYGLGIYLDVRFVLGFNYSFELGVTPRVRLEGLKLDDFSFALAIAVVRLDGLLVAELVGKPGIGLGLYALHPKLLRGGGGLAMPISAKAVVNPSGTVEVRYKPDGAVEGGARVGLVLTFGITAALKPYAEFSVLDGLYEPTWEGDALTEFVILEPRELFTYYVDFGAGLTKTEGEPELPAGDRAGKPPAKGSDEKKRIGTDRSAPKAEEPPRGKRSEELPTKPEEEPKAGKKEGGFDFASMVSQLLDSPKFRPIKKVLDAASATFDAIAGALKAVYNFFKRWFNVIQEGIDAFVDAIRTIARDGLIAYFKQLLKRKLGAFYDIIAPLFDALAKVAGKFEDLIAKLMEEPIPLTPVAFLGWVLSTLATIFQIAVGGIRDLVSALRKVLGNALDAFLDFVNYLVQEGKIGVRRHVYYVPRPVVSNIYFYAPTEYKLRIWGLDISEKVDGDLVGPSDVLSPSRIVHKAIAFLLWQFLDASSRIHSTGGWNDPDVDDDTRRDYWVDK